MLHFSKFYMHINTDFLMSAYILLGCKTNILILAQLL